jgi:hypothetical protein
VGRQGGGGAGLKGKRGRKKMWSRLERDEYRFARELWSPKSFRERERERVWVQDGHRERKRDMGQLGYQV